MPSSSFVHALPFTREPSSLELASTEAYLQLPAALQEALCLQIIETAMLLGLPARYAAPPADTQASRPEFRVIRGGAAIGAAEPPHTVTR